MEFPFPSRKAWISAEYIYSDISFDFYCNHNYCDNGFGIYLETIKNASIWSKTFDIPLNVCQTGTLAYCIS